MHRLAACLAVAPPLLLAACGSGTGAKIARTPLEKKSRFCKDGLALYRAGGILFCADPGERWGSRFTYSLAGNATGTFAQQVRDVVGVARCITGRRFEEAKDGQFAITIDNKIEPPTKEGMTHGGGSAWHGEVHIAGLRTGSTKISGTNAKPAGVGDGLEEGLWKFLGIARPQPMALAAFGFNAATPGAPPREIPDGARSCEDERVLFQTDGVRFCAKRKHAWPATLGYALVGDTKGFEPAATRTAAFVGRLAHIRFEASQKPNILVVLSEHEVTDASLAALLKARQIEPKEDVGGGALGVQHAFEEASKKVLGKGVGKPIAAVVAHFMATMTSSYSTGGRDGPTGSAIIGLHNRSPADTEKEIDEIFRKPLGIKLPAYHLPEACDAPGGP